MLLIKMAAKLFSVWRMKNPHLQSASVGRWSSSTAADPVEWRQPCRRSPSLTEHAPAPRWEDRNRKGQLLQTSLQQLFTLSSQQKKKQKQYID